MRVACLVAVAAIASCGDDDSPPDRDEIPGFVAQFFEDAWHKDAEAICSVATADGRAWAAGRQFRVHRDERLPDARPRRPASYEECVDAGAPRATVSTDLPGAMEHGYRPRVVDVRSVGGQVRVRIRFTGWGRTWVLTPGADGWLVDYFSMPVRE